MCLDKLENDEEMKKMVEGDRERDSAERDEGEKWGREEGFGEWSGVWQMEPSACFDPSFD